MLLTISTLLALAPVSNVRAEASPVQERGSATQYDDLCGAAEQGDLLQISGLIAKGADPNGKDSSGYPIINCAIEKNQVAALKVLLAAGADRQAAFEKPGGFRTPPIAFARNMEFNEIVALLEAKSPPARGKVSLKQAILDEDLDGITAAVQNGADLEKRFFMPSQRPLDYACDNDKVESVKRLVELGARINGYESVERPLFVCVRHARLEAVKFLVEHGAVIEDRDLKQAGHEAATHDYLSSIREAQTSTTVRRQPGNLDDDAFNRMRTSAGLPPEDKTPSSRSDVDEPKKRGGERPDDFALVIGIEDYQSLPKADYGAHDARAVRANLEAIGVPARNIVVLEGSGATGNKIKSYLEEWLPRNVKASSTLWVYYSGHGAPDPKSGQAFLVPWDGDPQFLKSTALPLNKLYSDLAKTKAKRVIVALDACFSGAGGRSVLAKGARPLVTKVDQGSAADKRITILAAASGDEITGTLDGQGHGMFTYFFLKGLGEGKSSAKSLFDYLNPRVQDEARRQNREQNPALIGEDAPL